MRPWLGEQFGNPSSMHAVGRRARAAVDEARARVAGLFGVEPEEVIFTASGSESVNVAIRGIMAQGGRVVLSAIEHPAALETVRALARRGVEAGFVEPGADGIVSPESLAAALPPGTRLVSVMAANNVVGTLQPVAELARRARAAGAVFHTDAVQAAGKIPLDLPSLGVDMLSLSAHKIPGPQGVGALIVRRGVDLEPLVSGGGQERGFRSGTENVAGIVGFGAAAQIAEAEMATEAVRIVALRERLIEGLQHRAPNVRVIGNRWRRLPGHVCLSFSGQEGDAIRMLLALDAEGICVSTGSACSAHHAGEPSHVLQAMGFDAIRARGSLRLTLGRFTTLDEIDVALDVMPRVAAELQPLATRR
jgi:cysteine desulfurase